MTAVRTILSAFTLSCREPNHRVRTSLPGSRHCKPRPPSRNIARMLQHAAHPADDPHRLTRDAVERFHLDGFAGPFRALAPEAMEPICRHLYAEVFPTDGPNPRDRTHSRHLDTPAIFALVSHPAVVGRITSILGDDLMVWTTGFFIKQPRERERFAAQRVHPSGGPGGRGWLICAGCAPHA